MPQSLAQLLVQQGVLGVEQVKLAAEQAQRGGGCFGTALVELGLLSETSLLALLVEAGVQRADLECIDADALRLLSADEAQRHLLIPLALRHGEGGAELAVAIVDPFDEQRRTDVEQATGCAVVAQVATPTEIREVIDAAYRQVETRVIPRPRETEPGHTAFGGQLSGKLRTRPLARAHPSYATVNARLDALLQLLSRKGLLSASELDELQKNAGEPADESGDAGSNVRNDQGS